MPGDVDRWWYVRMHRRRGQVWWACRCERGYVIVAPPRLWHRCEADALNVARQYRADWEAYCRHQGIDPDADA